MSKEPYERGLARGHRSAARVAAVIGAVFAAGCTGGRAVAPLTLRSLYGLKPATQIEAAQTALLLVDFQEEFRSGALPVPGAESAARRAQELLGWARRNSVLVVHVRQVASSATSPLFAPGTRTIAFLPGVEPREGELVVTKSMAGAFTRTDLGEQLASRGMKHIVLAGIMTHLAVDTTARDAAVLGYHVLVASDATATRSLADLTGSAPLEAELVQRAALASLGDRFAEILRSEEIVRLPVVGPPVRQSR